MNLTLTLLEWVVTSVFLILVVLTLRALLGKRVSACLRYALWAVVLVRLLVPVQLFSSPLTGIRILSPSYPTQSLPDAPHFPGSPGAEASVSQSPADALITVPSPPDFPPTPDPPIPPDFRHLPGWTVYLGWAWLAGAAAVAPVLLASNLRFSRKLRRVRLPLEGADCPLPVYVASDLPSPCLFGVFRPAVYVAPETASDSVMLRHVLIHEYTHFRHGDHIWNALRSLALALHWWNPLVWLSVVLSRRDCELACDEGALDRLDAGERIPYGRTLLSLITEKPRASELFLCATTMTGGQKNVLERVNRIAHAPKPRLWAASALVLVAALACLCAFGAAAEEAPIEDKSQPMPVETPAGKEENPPEDTPQPMPTAAPDDETANCQAVLQGRSKLILSEEDPPVILDDALLDKISDDPYMNYCRFAVVDMDADGSDEVLLYACGVANDCANYILLNQWNGEVHGTIFGTLEWRNRWFANLKTDGTFECTDSLGGHWWASVSYLRPTAVGSYSLHSLGVNKVSQEVDLERFMVILGDGSQEEYEQALAAQAAKPEAVWYDFTPENIAAAFPAQ